MDAGEVGSGHVRGAEDPELGQGRRLVRGESLLAVHRLRVAPANGATSPDCAEQADVSPGHDARGAHAGPERLSCAVFTLL